MYYDDDEEESWIDQEVERQRRQDRLNSLPAVSGPRDFLVPLVFPDVSIAVGEDSGFIGFLGKFLPGTKSRNGVVRANFLGHAAVVIVNGESGRTRYWEYGRYDKAGKGLTMNRCIKDVKIGKDHEPTSKSLRILMKQISLIQGHGTRVVGFLCHAPLGSFYQAETYCQTTYHATRAGTAEPYDWAGNSCLDFVRRTMAVVGLWSPQVGYTPVSFLDDLRISTIYEEILLT